jgi:uncharacterized protein (UPF0276 family)
MRTHRKTHVQHGCAAATPRAPRDAPRPRAPGCRFDLPNLGFGLGLRTTHFPYLLESTPEVDWFEILSENFMRIGGRPMHVLDRVAERWPIVMHGVSMSIGTTDPLDFGYLAELRKLAARVHPVWISDHLCWTGVAHRTSHDLLPVPYDEETLRHVVSRVKIVQDVLERPLVVENPSSYVAFRSSTMGEADFLARLAEEADCALLLDVNNVYVSAFNHGFDPVAYLETIPHDRVVQYHLAGHTHHGTHILDTHSDHVVDGVWDLFRRSWAMSGGRATMVEWDENVPPFGVVHAEVLKAKALVEGRGRRSGAATGSPKPRRRAAAAGVRP